MPVAQAYAATAQAVADTLVALEVRGVGVAFGGVQALDGVSLQLAPGEIVGVIGPNGAGKTTLFDCISGHLACTGRIALAGRDISRLRPHQRAAAGLGRSYQDARLYPSLTVWDTLRTASELHHRRIGPLASLPGLPPARRAERIAKDNADRVVALLGLERFAGKFIRELSTGTRRIVDLAALLIQRPRVILFDEPSSGIAQREAEALAPLLQAIRIETDAALLVIEHDMPLLLGIADRLYALETGRVIAHGDPGGVVRHPTVVASYLGEHAGAINRSGTPAPSPVTSDQRRRRRVSTGA